MYEQLLHIAEASGRPNTTVQVLPFGSGAYMPVQGGFITLRFADAEDGDIVSVELLARRSMSMTLVKSQRIETHGSRCCRRPPVRQIPLI
nr:Scr1 family TA system antitoxin-like transcriptional regulator [Actinoplanes derwentensis]GID84568.1 hypothetical protein Ade03nite_34920 [Actinoplanes derwentensis]